MTDNMTVRQQGRINVVFNQQDKQQQASRRLPKTADIKAKMNDQPLKDLEKKLNQMVGMDMVKETVKEIYAWIYINQLRQEQNLKTESQSLHMIFKGNPGTGKTTIARLIGELFRDMNVLEKGHLIEAERADLVGEYIGQTAQKTRDLIKKASGGVLFVDEAYALARGGEKDFGKEAIDTLVKHMEDKKGEFILILAGYPKEMDEFLRLNPGLPSRFPNHISFPDYSDNELMQITQQMLDDREYRMTSEAKAKFSRHLQHKLMMQHQGFSNGRYIRNMIEKMIRRQAVRLMREGSMDKESLLTLRIGDIMIEDSDEYE
ncbi:stage V sporulation protein K [Tuberibacillus sp. Marseille-P3662]|uniref:stage V sporulation protein K n=1 Tax=Tuberibacillus sp. Marseille-P3662 TaxID=1965358 RepID=UPI000A1C981B|nr:stage V sporulation protein K [Tuberibacillus sp. Marseille-P3662]